MFPNQIPNQINQPNDSNKPPNINNMGNMGGTMPYYPYHFINQQFPNQIPPNFKQNQQPQRSKKEPRKRSSIIQVQSTPLNQPMQNPIYPPTPPPPPSQIQPQTPEINVNIDYPRKLMSISDDRLDFFCQLFEIPLINSRQAAINYFMSTTLNRLCQNNTKLLNIFFEHLTNPNDQLLNLREPKIPRIFKTSVGIRSRYLLLQFFQGTPFEFVHLSAPPSGSICVGQFICDNTNNIPFGTVKVNDREIVPVDFGEIGSYFLFGPPENLNHVSLQLNSTLIEHFYVWLVIQYLTPNHSFAQEFIRERTPNPEIDEQCLISTTLCKGCPPFQFQPAIESSFITGFISCPTCGQKIKFEQIIIDYKSNTILNTTTNSSNNQNSSINGYQNLMLGTQSGQISRFSSGNSMGIIPMTPPQMGTPQQMQIPQQQQTKKSRPKKLNVKTPNNSQPPLQMQMPMQMGMNNMNNINNINNINNMNNISNINNMSNMNNMNNIAVMKNMHGMNNMNNMMPMKNMNMGNMMNMNVNMNVGMRNTVPINPQMNMNIINPTEIKNKPLLSSPTQNSNQIPIVQQNMNPIINGMNQQPSQPLQPPAQKSVSSTIHQQGQIQLNQNVSTPNQPPQPPTTTQQPQPQPQKPPKPPKQPKQRKAKSQQEDDEQQKSATNKNLSKPAKLKPKSAKAQSQPPSQADPVATVAAVATTNGNQSLHTSSTPQFLEKQTKTQKAPDVEEAPMDTPEMKKARMNMTSFLCMSLKCGKNELNWKECVYENDSELKIQDSNFQLKEYQGVDDYLDYVDSFM